MRNSLSSLAKIVAYDAYIKNKKNEVLRLNQLGLKEAILFERD